MLARLATGLTLLAATKILVRYIFIGPLTPPIVLAFSIVDAAMTIMLTPWAAMGQPLPRRRRIYRRALLVAAASTLALALVNLLLQVPGVYGGAIDLPEALLLIALVALPRSFFINPIGGLVVMLLASGVGWAWLKLRLPRAAAGRARPASSARAGAAAGTGGAGRAARARPAPGGRRPRPG